MAAFAKSWQRVLINAQIAAPLLWAIHIGCPKNCTHCWSLEKVLYCFHENNECSKCEVVHTHLPRFDPHNPRKRLWSPWLEGFDARRVHQ
jgi:hypothetical protein